MEVWLLMWMLEYEAGSGENVKTAYQPRTQEVVGTKATCEEKARQLRLYYLTKGIKFGNVYCVRKEDDD